MLKFPEGDKLSPPILQLDEVTFHYVPDKPVLENVNVNANMESRVCIVSVGNNFPFIAAILTLLYHDNSTYELVHGQFARMKYGTIVLLSLTQKNALGRKPFIFYSRIVSFVGLDFIASNGQRNKKKLIQSTLLSVRYFVVIFISDNFLGVSIDHYSYFLKVGENGAGKTTLLKILLGELNPVKGIRHAHRNLKIGYFSQHHVDQLEMNMNSVEVLATKLPGKVNVEKFIGPVQRYFKKWYH